MRPGVDALVLLGVVAGHDVVPEADVAGVGRPLAGEHPEEARLAGAVEAHDEQPLAALDGEVDVAEHLVVAVAHGQALALEHDAAGRRRRREPHVHRPAARGASTLLSSRRTMRFSMLWAIDALVALAPKRSTRVWSRSISLAWRWAALARRTSSLARCAEVLGVGALVLLDRAELVVVVAVEVQHAGDGLVEQVEVVADHEQGAAVGPHEAEQPLLGVAVEVVGGLVEEQHVAAGEEDAGDLDPAPLAAGQRRRSGRSSRSASRPRPAAMRRTSLSAA